MKQYTATTDAYLRGAALTRYYLRQPNGDKTAILLTDKQAKDYRERGITLYDSKN